jgi:hypothetical protein
VGGEGPGVVVVGGGEELRYRLKKRIPPHGHTWSNLQDVGIGLVCLYTRVNSHSIAWHSIAWHSMA